MTSRSHACGGWLSSRRSHVMAASIGSGERDSQRLENRVVITFLATFSGTTDTRSDVARICAADKNGARIAVLGQALISAAKKPLITDRLAV